MLGLGLGLQYRGQLPDSLGQLYLRLANADGGSGGSISCAETSFKSLLDI